MADLQATQFRDSAGRVWTVRLNYAVAGDIRESHGVDFVNAHKGRAYASLFDDDKLLVAVLFDLLATQIEAAKLTPRQFAEGLDGEVLAAALDAIRGAIESFTRPDLRPAIAELNATIDATRKKATTLARDKIASKATQAAIDRALAQSATKIDDELARIGTSAAGDSPPNSPG